MTEETRLHRDDDAIQWEERVSEHGKKYRVGRLRDENAEQEATQTVSARLPFSIDVDWTPIEGNTDWMATDSRVRDRAKITRYCIVANEMMYPQYWYECTLWFSNTDHYDYYFTDGTGDTYECNTFLNRDHWIWYETREPNIAHIKGT